MSTEFFILVDNPDYKNAKKGESLTLPLMNKISLGKRVNKKFISELSKDRLKDLILDSEQGYWFIYNEYFDHYTYEAFIDILNSLDYEVITK